MTPTVTLRALARRHAVTLAGMGATPRLAGCLAPGRRCPGFGQNPVRAYSVSAGIDGLPLSGLQRYTPGLHRTSTTC